MNAPCANPGSFRFSFADTPLTLPKERRVLRSAEFRKVYKAGVRVTSRYFAAFFLPLESDGQPSRVGFTLPRALGTAVLRNRLKRRMREAVRAHLSQLGEDWAVVFNPRRAALDASFDELSSEVSRVLLRCKKS